MDGREHPPRSDPPPSGNSPDGRDIAVSNVHMPSFGRCGSTLCRALRKEGRHVAVALRLAPRLTARSLMSSPPCQGSGTMATCSCTIVRQYLTAVREMTDPHALAGEEFHHRPAQISDVRWMTVTPRNCLPVDPTIRITLTARYEIVSVNSPAGTGFCLRDGPSCCHGLIDRRAMSSSVGGIAKSSGWPRRTTSCSCPPFGHPRWSRHGPAAMWMPVFAHKRRPRAPDRCGRTSPCSIERTRVTHDSTPRLNPDVRNRFEATWTNTGCAAMAR
jgi:hypothetical protein